MKYDVIVIGLGSAGLMIADRLNDSGLKVTFNREWSLQCYE